jgi:phosphoribosyl-AMP cyclohydrolase / phosphoribosyl-ATP pyrophosphohydrolase
MSPDKNIENLVNQVNYRIKWQKKDGSIEELVVVATQDYATNELLMVAYANREAVRMTLTPDKDGKRWATYWRRSDEKIWVKGKDKSGNYQEVKEVYWDCDKDTLLYKVKPLGPACHTDTKTCFVNGRIF